MSYAWKIKRFKADPNKVKAELDALGIGISGVGFEAEEIVNAARDPNSELHKCFEWNDSIAAEHWRKQQARTIMVNLVYVDNSKEKPEKTDIRVFVNNNRSEGYKPMSFVVSKQDEYQQLLDMALKELQSFQKKYQTLSNISSGMSAVFSSINQLFNE